MAEVVFVLGAGASAGSGAPLMANFLDVAEDLWLGEKTGNAAPHFERVFRSIAALKSVHAQVSLDTYNLESVFSTFEMGAMIGRLGSIDQADDIEATRKAMVWVIARTLQEKVRLPVSDRRVRPPVDYEAFAALLKRVRGSRSSRGSAIRPAAVVTLNYDLGLDYALHWHSVPATYCLDESIPGPPVVPVLKLHGSLNWGTCIACGQLVPWDMLSFTSKYSWNLMPGQEGSVTLNVADFLPSVPHCTSNLRPEPVVVPPTWNKSENQLLRHVWRQAARELSEARYIVFAGYSFPDTDLYFRYLLSLGLAGDTRIRRIAVLNPDRSALDKLNGILTPTLQKRVTFLESNFDSDGIELLGQVCEVGP